MDPKDFYGDYLNCLKTIVSLIDKGEADQNQIEQNKRDTENDIDKKYNNLLSNIAQAKMSVRNQYKSVWESCTNMLVSFKKPQDQRPEATTLTWEAAIKIQDEKACVIRDWFSARRTQALIEKERLLREREEIKRKQELKEQIESQKKAEIEKQQRAEAAAAIIEQMKRRHKRK